MITCYLDMDGVISDFVSGVYKAFNVTDDPYEKPENWGQWEIQDILGIPDEEFYGKMDHAFWEGLPKTKEADEIVNLVLDTFGENNIRICTTPTDNWGSYSGKYAWLDIHYPFLRRSLITTKHKHELAGPNRFLIDDSDKNTKAFQAAGGAALLYPRRWNSYHPLAGSGLELFKIFLGEFRE